MHHGLTRSDAGAISVLTHRTAVENGRRLRRRFASASTFGCATKASWIDTMSTLTTSQPNNRAQKLALVVGYLALAGGVLFAYGKPAASYEIDIYAATPIGFWLGIAIALLIAVFVTLYAPEGYVSLAGLTLGGGAIASVAALPLLRSYFYYGNGDGLTHLGWTRDLFEGSLSAFGLFYPGIHTSALFVRGVAGTTIPRSLLLIVFAYVLVYLVFIPLCVRSMTSHRGAMLLGGLMGLLLLPINHQGVNYMSPHPISDSILVTPVVVYLLINYLTSPSDVFDSRLPISAVSAAFAITLGATVLFHPQQAANLIILFITLSGVQFLYRSIRPDSAIADHRTMYGPTAFIIGSFMLWSVGRSRFGGSVDAVIREVLSFLSGGANVGASTASQASSLTAIGGSILELFLKLFGVSLVVAALAGLLMLTSLSGRLRDAPDTRALVKYFTIGLVVLIPYSLVFYIGSISELFFRNAGLIMLFSTILGSIALYRYVSGLSEIVPVGGVRAVLSVIIVAMLALSVVVVFPSPYIFLPNDQVTETQMSGYQFAFNHGTEETPIYGLRSGPWRYKHGVLGVEGTPVAQGSRSIPGENLSALAGRTSNNRYVAVTDAARQREVQVYRSLRYSRENVSALDNQPGVSLVQTNGDFDLYLVAGSNPADAGASATVSNETRTAGVNRTTPRAPPTNRSVFGNASPRTQRARTPTATATPTATPTPTETTTATATPTTTDSGSIFGSFGDSSTTTATPTSTQQARTTATATPTPTATATPTASPTSTATPTTTDSGSVFGSFGGSSNATATPTRMSGPTVGG
jgi:hypothetical protein